MRRWEPETLFRFWGELPSALASVRVGTRLVADESLADAIIVLGCKLLPNGEPSGSLRARAEAGARLWLEGRAPVLITTGASHETPPGEAVVAAAIARAMGVPEAAIRLEEKSRNTDGNFAFSVGLMPGPRVIVVTEPFHMARALAIAKAYRLDPIPYPVRSPAWERPMDRARLTVRDAVSFAWWRAERARSG